MRDFVLGETIVTPAAGEAVVRAGWSVEDVIARHQAGDWGAISDFHRELNELALQSQLDLISLYQTPGGDLVRVYTKADRSHTLVHLAQTKAMANASERPTPSEAPASAELALTPDKAVPVQLPCLAAC